MEHKSNKSIQKRSKTQRAKQRMLVTRNWNLQSGALPGFNSRIKTDNTVFKVQQDVTGFTTLTTSTSAPTFGSASFTLAQLDQYVSFQNIFDQYRLAEVEVWVFAQPDNSQTVENLLTSEIATVVDYDDNSNLTTFAQALDYPDATVTSLLQGHYKRFVPHIALGAYTSSFVGFANFGPQWIDAASSTVSHYGLKLAAAISAVATKVQIRTRLHFEFRNVR
jgi:hypothetical protein